MKKIIIVLVLTIFVIKGCVEGHDYQVNNGFEVVQIEAHKNKCKYLLKGKCYSRGGEYNLIWITSDCGKYYIGDKLFLTKKK